MNALVSKFLSTVSKVIALLSLVRMYLIILVICCSVIASGFSHYYITTTVGYAAHYPGN